ncbi:hypothetical protein [Streptomyces mirabilis]
MVRGVAEGAADRLAVGLRAGSFGLGAMWAVVSGAERRQVTACARIAHRVAVHLMRRRTEGAGRGPPRAGAPPAFDDCWARAALIRVPDPTVVADLETVTPLWGLSGYTSIRTPCATD